MNTYTGAFAALLVASTIACGHAMARPTPNRDVITAEQMRDENFRTAYEAVISLHPNWLITRPKTFAAEQPGVVVYMDSNRMPNGVESLKEMQWQMIEYIRRYDAIEATQRWGVGHTEGAIMVSTQPR